MKKNLIALIVVALILPAFRVNALYDSSASQIYLQNHSQSPWSTMALSALGASQIPFEHLKNISSDKAIDYEAPILAIAAINQNPAAFYGNDYVAKLKSFFNQNQIGDPAAVNDDIFGILAFVSAGLKPNDPVIAGAKNFIFQSQNKDGGWGYAGNAASDSNTTALAITALKSVGIDSSDLVIIKALEFLKSAQNGDGGFTYDPKSTFGTESDAASTAWVMWALNGLGIDQASWSKNGKNARTYLEMLQKPGGYFVFQADSKEDSFTHITTAYAVIALLGKSMPIKVFQSPSSFKFRIEGAKESVCEGSAMGPTALDIVKNASQICGFEYHIQTTAFGPYLDKISSDSSSGLSGWMYLVNNKSPDVGAADYVLKTGDEVLWYFGEFGWQPSRISLTSEILNSGESVLAKVELYSSDSWKPVENASVYLGASAYSTGASGAVELVGESSGYFQVFAEKTGIIRSNKILLKIGSPSSNLVDLTVNIGGKVEGAETKDNTVAFSVSQNSLDFGNLNGGGKSAKSLTIQNTGSENIRVGSAISGDAVFSDNLQIDETNWKKFTTDISAGGSKIANIKLVLPGGYAGNGKKTGQLIFWATAK